MGCASTLPGRGKNPGWICTGQNLVTLMTTTFEGRQLPCVVPAERVGMMMSTEMASAYSPEPYDNSGDHLHLTLPKRVVVDWLDGVLREYVTDYAGYGQHGGESVLEIYDSPPRQAVVTDATGSRIVTEPTAVKMAIPLRSVREWHWEGR
jgi:hypothetical protein